MGISGGLMLAWLLSFWLAATCFGVAAAALLIWWFWEVAVLFAIIGFGAMGAHRGITEMLRDD
jgi:hypothetical protein